MARADYECQQCGHIEEVHYAVGHTPVPLCSKCGGNTLRVFPIGGTAPGFVLKGGGWPGKDGKGRT